MAARTSRGGFILRTAAAVAVAFAATSAVVFLVWTCVFLAQPNLPAPADPFVQFAATFVGAGVGLGAGRRLCDRWLASYAGEVVSIAMIALTIEGIVAESVSPPHQWQTARFGQLVAIGLFSVLWFRTAGRAQGTPTDRSEPA